MVKEAEGYKIERIRKAEGEVEKFNKILSEYKNGEYVTQLRIYLETMEEILPRMKKFILDLEDHGSLINLLPLTDLNLLTNTTQEVKK